MAKSKKNQGQASPISNWGDPSLLQGGWGGQASQQKMHNIALATLPGHKEAYVDVQNKKAAALQKELLELEQQGEAKKKAEEELKKQEAKIAQEEKIKKLEPKTVVEEKVANRLGPGYVSYKDKKNRLEELEKKTYAKLRENIFEDVYKDRALSTKPKEKVKNFFKNIYNFGVGVSATAESLYGAGLSKLKKSNQFTDKEEEEYERLKDEVHKAELPDIKAGKKEVTEEKAKLQKQIDYLTKQSEKTNHNFDALSMGPVPLTDWKSQVLAGTEGSTTHDLERLKLAKENLEKAEASYDDAIAGSSFWRGLSKDFTNTASLGIEDWDNQGAISDIVNKIKEGEELTESEKILAESFAIRQASQGIHNSNYNLGDGIRQSGMFMAETIILSYLTGGTGLGAKAAQFAGKAGRAGAAALDVAGAVGKNKTAMGVLNMAKETGIAALHPSTATKSLEAYNSQLQKIDTGDNTEWVASEGQKKDLARTLVTSKQAIKTELSKIEKQIDEQIENGEDPSEDLIARAETLNENLSKVDDNINKLVDKDGNVIVGETTGFDAAIKGWTGNITERFAEKYVGHFVDPALAKVADASLNNKLVRAVGKTKVGKGIGSIANRASSAMKGGRRYIDDKLFDTTALGTLSKQFATHSGAAKMIHSLPSEMLEEVAVQLTPQYMEDYNKQLNELTSIDFYKQVALSTLIMNGTMSSFGALAKGAKYATNAETRLEFKAGIAAKKEMRDRYRSLDAAITDDQVAKDIAMNTLGTIFDYREYQKRILELRNEKPEDFEGMTLEERKAKADELEKNSFFNMAIQAFETGTQKDFRKSLKGLERKEGLSDETKSAIGKSLGILERLENTYNAHKRKINANTITNLLVKGEIADASLINLREQERAEYGDNASNIIAEEFLRVKDKINNDEISDALPADASELTYENIQNNQALSNAVASYSDNSYILKEYFERKALENSLIESQQQIKESLAYETDNNNAAEIRKREIGKWKGQLLSTVNADNVNEVKKALEDLGELDTETLNTLNRAALDTAGVNPTTNTEENTEEDTEEETEEDTEENTEEETGDVEEETGDTPETITPPPSDGSGSESFFSQDEDLENILTAGTVIDPEAGPKFDVPDEDDVTHDLAPVVLDEDNQNHLNIVQKLKEKFIADLKAGSKPDLDGALAGMRSQVGAALVEQNFNFIAAAFQEATNIDLSEEDLQRIYVSHFGNFSQQELLQIFGTPVTNSTPTQVVQQPLTPAQIEQKEATVVVATNDPKVKETRINPETNAHEIDKVAPHTATNYQGIGLKSGDILGLDYVETEDGKFTVSQTVNETAKPFLDWRNFPPGTEIEFVFNMDYFLDTKNYYTKWENLDAQNLNGTDKPTKKKMPVMDYLLELFAGDPELDSWPKIEKALQDYKETKDMNNPLFRNEEFLKVVPVGTVNPLAKEEMNPDGTFKKSEEAFLGGLNNYYWFNTANVALFLDKKEKALVEEREARIEENRRILLEARKQILANGSLKTTVLENASTQSNKRPEDSFFSSLLNEFETVEEFNKMATIGIYTGGSGIFGGKVAGTAKQITVNGKEVRISQIINWDNFRERLDGNNNTPALFHQEGVDIDGNPLYVARFLNTMHPDQQEDYRRTAKNADDFRIAIFSDDGFANKYPADKIKEFQKRYKKVFGYQITNFKDFNNKLRKLYPEKSVKDGKMQGYRFDYGLEGHGDKIIQKIPDLSRYDSFKDFADALLRGDEIHMVDKKEYFLKSVHTNLIFTPIERNGETIRTSAAQPMMTFAFENSTGKPRTNNTINLKNAKIDKLAKRKINIEKALSEATEQSETDTLRSQLKDVEAKLKEANVTVLHQNSPAALPGSVQDNSELINTLAEVLGTEDKAEAQETMLKFFNNFVSLNADSIVDNLEAEGTIKKECN